MYIDACSLIKINFRELPKLTLLVVHFYNNNSIDLSGCSNLKEFDCVLNNLTSIIKQIANLKIQELENKITQLENQQNQQTEIVSPQNNQNG